MRTSSLEFLSMMTSSPSASWSVDTNRRSEVSCGNLRARTWRWRMIWRRRPSCAPTNTFAAFVVKLAFPPGFIASPITVSEKKRGAARSLSGLMRRGSKRRLIRR
jgi:hypothetical protein